MSRALSIGVIFVCATLVGCETIPQVGTARPEPPTDQTVPRKLHRVLDQRAVLTRSSLVERSGQHPIVMLGDERFGVPPVEVLDRRLAKQFPEGSILILNRFDVRYIQGGDIDELSGALAMGVGGPLLGAIFYGGMAARARSVEPSRVEITVEGTWDSHPITVKHAQDLSGMSEADALRIAVDVTAEKVLARLRHNQLPTTPN